MEDSSATTTQDINRALADQLEKSKTVKIEGLYHHDCVAVGISNQSRVIVGGDAGDFFAAYNNGAKVRLNGDARRFAGDSCASGEIAINGDAGSGAGTYMQGGLLIIKGDCGARCGQGMYDGTIIVDGECGELVGLYQSGGEIVITGGCGRLCGHAKSGGNIFIGGEAESLGYNCTEKPLDDGDIEVLSALFKKFGITKNPGKFKKFSASVPSIEYEREGVRPPVDEPRVARAKKKIARTDDGADSGAGAKARDDAGDEAEGEGGSGGENERAEEGDT